MKKIYLYTTAILLSVFFYSDIHGQQSTFSIDKADITIETQKDFNIQYAGVGKIDKITFDVTYKSKDKAYEIKLNKVVDDQPEDEKKEVDINKPETENTEVATDIPDRPDQQTKTDDKKEKDETDKTNDKKEKDETDKTDDKKILATITLKDPLVYESLKEKMNEFAQEHLSAEKAITEGTMSGIYIWLYRIRHFDDKAPITGELVFNNLILYMDERTEKLYADYDNRITFVQSKIHDFDAAKPKVANKISERSLQKKPLEEAIKYGIEELKGDIKAIEDSVNFLREKESVLSLLEDSLNKAKAETDRLKKVLTDNEKEPDSEKKLSTTKKKEINNGIIEEDYEGILKRYNEQKNEVDEYKKGVHTNKVALLKDIKNTLTSYLKNIKENDIEQLSKKIKKEYTTNKRSDSLDRIISQLEEESRFWSTLKEDTTWTPDNGALSINTEQLCTEYEQEFYKKIKNYLRTRNNDKNILTEHDIHEITKDILEYLKSNKYIYIPYRLYDQLLYVTDTIIRSAITNNTMLVGNNKKPRDTHTITKEIKCDTLSNMLVTSFLKLKLQLAKAYKVEVGDKYPVYKYLKDDLIKEFVRRNNNIDKKEKELDKKLLSLRKNNIVKIDEICIQFERGFIERIMVWLTINGKQEIFENNYAIGFSSVANFKSLKKTRLYSRNSSTIYPYIYLSDVFSNYNNMLYNYTRDYSPADTVVCNINPGDSKIIPLLSDRLVTLFDSKIFTDFRGLNEETPNGLVQIEVSKRFNINTSRIPAINRNNYGYFNYIQLWGGVSKIEKQNRTLILRNDKIVQNNTLISPSYATNLDIRNYERIYAGLDLNLFLFDAPDYKFTIYADMGARYSLVEVQDSLYTVDNSGTVSVGTAPNFQANTLGLAPKFIVEVFSEKRVGFTLKYQYNYTYLFSNNKFKQVASYEKSPTDVTILEPHARSSHMLELNVNILPNMDADNKFFLRGRLFWQEKDVNTSFSQIQFGYSYNLFYKK